MISHVHFTRAFLAFPPTLLLNLLLKFSFIGLIEGRREWLA